ncbi:MAG: 23S rRNA (guanosine(2251)-2'-O)-methyltransferase RlmB [Thermoanaerobacteraceae bacterium]|nr:23S rRNA (guanosine(2251)-2'-O)-methyltransferase RlmB [Thermoanaerobacteraceae bacterium]
MEEILAGRQAVREALKAGRPLNKILVAHGAEGRAVSEIVYLAREQGVPLQKVDRRALNRVAGEVPHQGVVALAAAKGYVEVEDLLEASRQRQEPPFLLMLDGVEDPQNLGAVLRLADACGVHGVIIPRRRSAGLSPAVARVAAGAVEYVPVARVANLGTTLEALKERGLWAIGAEGDGETLAFAADFTLPLVLVLGGEGKGLSYLVRRKCDLVVRLPMRGHINSLNIAAAAAVLLYEVVRQREFPAAARGMHHDRTDS